MRRSASVALRAYETPLLVSSISQNATINKQTHRVDEIEKEEAQGKERERALPRV